MTATQLGATEGGRDWPASLAHREVLSLEVHEGPKEDTTCGGADLKDKGGQCLEPSRWPCYREAQCRAMFRPHQRWRGWREPEAPCSAWWALSVPEVLLRRLLCSDWSRPGHSRSHCTAPGAALVTREQLSAFVPREGLSSWALRRALRPAWRPRPHCVMESSAGLAEAKALDRHTGLKQILNNHSLTRIIATWHLIVTYITSNNWWNCMPMPWHGETLMEQELSRTCTLAPLTTQSAVQSTPENFPDTPGCRWWYFYGLPLFDKQQPMINHCIVLIPNDCYEITYCTDWFLLYFRLLVGVSQNSQ